MPVRLEWQSIRRRAEKPALSADENGTGGQQAPYTRTDGSGMHGSLRDQPDSAFDAGVSDLRQPDRCQA